MRQQLKFLSLLLLLANVAVFCSKEPINTDPSLLSNYHEALERTDSICVDSVRIAYSLMSISDTCKTDSTGKGFGPCCYFKFSAQTFPESVTKATYRWSLENLSTGALINLGIGKNIFYTMPSNPGPYRICVKIQKPGCPSIQTCRTFKFDPKTCSIHWTN